MVLALAAWTPIMLTDLFELIASMGKMLMLIVFVILPFGWIAWTALHNAAH